MRRSNPLARCLALALGLAAALPAAALDPSAATEAYSPLRPRYEIRAELVGREIRADLRLRLENATSRPLGHLVLNLYPEAFRRGSVFHHESKAPAAFEDPRETFPAADEEGGLELTELSVDGSPVSGSRRGILLEVPLATPLEPGGRLELTARFRTTLPAFDWRSGSLEGIAFAGQWYPQLAALDAASGEFRRQEYHRYGEFETDVADYRVELRVPDPLVVGATGRLEAGVWLAEGVRDFAWVAGPYADVAEAATPDGVKVRVLTRQGSQRAERILEQALDAIGDLGRRYGRYPYRSLTVAETPIDGGMEYPTIVFVGSDTIEHGGSSLLEVVTHEIAHQWWAMLVGNDGLDEPWIDEGLATYTTASVLDERLAPRKRGLRFGAPLGWFWPALSFRERALVEAQVGDSLWPARPVAGRNVPWPDPISYVTAVYSRAARAFWTLEDQLGRKGMDAFLSGIVERHAYRRLAGAQLIDEIDDARARETFRTALGRTPEAPARRIRFSLLPFPLPETITLGVLPVFGGRSRDELVVGLRLFASAPFAIRGLSRPFLALPRHALNVDLLTRVDDASPAAVLTGLAALGRQAALEARAELQDGTTLLGLELSRLTGRSAFVGPFRLGRLGLRYQDEPGFRLLTGRVLLRHETTRSLLVPRNGVTLLGWLEAGRELDTERWAARGGVQAGAFLPLHERLVGWVGAAAAAAEADPRRLPLDSEGWLTAWPDERASRLLSARAELSWQPKGDALLLGLAAGAGRLPGDSRWQAGPSVHLFGEMPFSMHLDLPLWAQGGEDEGFAFRWALRIGPRVGD